MSATRNNSHQPSFALGEYTVNFTALHSILVILLNKEKRNLERPSIELVKSVKVHRRGAKVVAWEIEEVGGPLPWARTKLELQKFVMTHGVLSTLSNKQWYFNVF